MYLPCTLRVASQASVLKAMINNYNAAINHLELMQKLNEGLTESGGVLNIQTEKSGYTVYDNFMLFLSGIWYLEMLKL